MCRLLRDLHSIQVNWCVFKIREVQSFLYSGAVHFNPRWVQLL